MTSPVGGKPENKNEKYNEVYSRGSTYGSDLRTREDVEKLLLRKPQSGFVKFMSGIANGFNQFVNDLAEIFKGNGGAKYEVLKVAVDERFKTEINGVTEAVDRAQKELEKANTALAEQGKLTEQQKRDLESAKVDLGKAGRDAREALAALSKLEGETSSIREALSKKVGNNELTRVSQDLAAARQRAGELSEDLEKLSHSVDSGAEGSGSIITFNADGVPHWFSENSGAERGFFGGSDKLYLGAKHVLSKTDISSASYDYYGSDHYVRVHKGIPYRWSAWVYVTAPSNIGITFRAGKDSAPCDGTHFLMDFSEEASPIADLGQYGFGVRVNTANKWVRVSGSLVFEEEHDFVSLRQLEWNWGVSNGASIRQAVGDISVVPVLDDGAPLGGSLIPYQPGTSEPLWWSAAKQGMAKSYPDSHPDWSFPDGHQWRTAEQAGVRVSPFCTKKLVKVIPGVDYTFKIWTQAVGPGSVLYIELRNQNGDRCVKSGGLNDNGDAKAMDYPVCGLRVPRERKHWVTKTLRFTDDTREVYLHRFFFNHASGEVTNQWIAGIECYPSVVDQAMIDRLQFEAIRKNEVVGSSNKSAIAVLEDTAANQAKWNETQRIVNEKQAGWNKMQYLVNSKQGLWNKAASDAIEALKKWSGFQYLGTSCVPLVPGTGTPEWTLASRSKAAPYEFPEGDISVPGSAFVHVSSDLEYDVEITWSGPADGSIHFYAQNNIPPIKEAYLINGGKRFFLGTQAFSLGDNLTSSEKTSSYVVRFNPEVSAVRINKFTVSGALRVRDIKITPHVPSQAEVDAAQNKAIQAIDKFSRLEADTSSRFRDTQTSINNISAKVDAAQNKTLQIHQDTLELLDIRTPKSYYLDASKGSSGSNNWFRWYESRNGSQMVLKIVCLGTWSGKLQFTSNWSNGAADNFVVDVKNSPVGRAFLFKGGAAHISRRGYSITLYPNCLNRTYTIRRVNKSLNDSIKDPGHFLRGERNSGRLLFRGPVTANYSVNTYPTDDLHSSAGKSIVKAGEIIQGDYIEPPIGKVVVFTEVDTSTAYGADMDTTEPTINTIIDVNHVYADLDNMSSDWGSSGFHNLSG